MPAPARQYHQKVVHEISATVGFADNGTAVEIGTLPAGAIVLRATAIVQTAFDAGTANVLDIGTAADPDGFATDIALGTIGNIAGDEMATTNDQGPYTEETTLYATPALSGTAATAGVAHIVIEYIPEVA